jgi:hypothetical protein
MVEYAVVSLKTFCKRYDEDRVREILSSFSCPKNYDVEHFLKENAIDFLKKGIAATHLIFSSSKEEDVLSGYFTLANKVFVIQDDLVSSKWKARIHRFGELNESINRYLIPMPLIGQLARNDAAPEAMSISGDELIDFAFEKISIVQDEIAGKMLLVECADISELTGYYERNNFFRIDTHASKNKNTELVRLIKYSS